MNAYQFLALWSLGQAMLCRELGLVWYGGLNLIVAYAMFSIVALMWLDEWLAEREIIRRVIEIELEKANDRP